MKKSITIIYIILLVSFVLSLSSVQAKTGKITLDVGQSKQLSSLMKRSAKWKSKNSKIVKIIKNKKIKGIKKGKTKIVAYNGKVKKVFWITVKNSYYNANFENVVKMTVRNLDNGQTEEFTGKDILWLQDKINKKVYYRKIGKSKLATGDLDYMFLMYDKNDNLLQSISFGDKNMVITKGDKSKEYISKKALDISRFEF